MFIFIMQQAKRNEWKKVVCYLNRLDALAAVGRALRVVALWCIDTLLPLL